MEYKFKLNPWKDKIRRIRFIREPFERVRTEPKAKEHNNVVQSSRLNKVIGNRE